MKSGNWGWGLNVSNVHNCKTVCCLNGVGSFDVGHSLETYKFG